jgi:hypothetical protein
MRGGGSVGGFGVEAEDEFHQRILQLVKRRGYRARELERISLPCPSSMGAVGGCIGPSVRRERGPQDDKYKMPRLYRSDELLRHPKANSVLRDLHRGAGLESMGFV